jgi:hypothetical protein
MFFKGFNKLVNEKNLKFQNTIIFNVFILKPIADLCSLLDVIEDVNVRAHQNSNLQVHPPEHLPEKIT